VIAYLDSSVLLRVVLGQGNALEDWKSIERGVSSALTEVECLRTLDRLRLAESLDDEQTAVYRGAVYDLLEAMETVSLTQPVLFRASQPPPTALGTLDALHLATALLWRERRDSELVMATHDRALGTAARACGLRVIGI
jgi:predicted nucleic acid-binding protein